MKKIFSLLIAIIFATSLWAQCPQKMSYQAIVRDTKGDLIRNQEIGMQISILQGTIYGASVYVEEHIPTSNTNGLISIEIGGGTVLNGAFANIDWADENYFLEIQIDLNGGTDYTITSTDQFISVPYALHAVTAEKLVNGGDIEELDPIFTDSEAYKVNSGDITNLRNLSGTNTGDQNLSGYAMIANVLSLNNTTSFTPDTDYEPATKKYVDDNLGEITGTYISDIDGDTKIQLEEADDEDIIRIDIAGEEKWKFIGSRLEPVATGNSVFIGEGAGLNDDLSDNSNTFLGHRAGYANISGATNTFVGMQAGYANTSGNSNVFVGERSGVHNTVGTANTAIGSSAGFNNTNGENNLFLGYMSGHDNTIGSDNAMMGYQAGYSNTSGNDDIFIGHQSGYNNTVGSDNIFIGNESGYNNTEGTGNIFIGPGAGNSTTTVDHNFFIGVLAGGENTIGEHNSFLGYRAGAENTEGDDNLFVGHFSGYTNTIGDNNTYLGYKSGYSNIEGSGNVFVGGDAGYTNTAGDHNTFTGYKSGYNNTLGDNNAFYGFVSGYANTEGLNNSFFGDSSGYANTVGADNSFFGYKSGLKNTEGDYNTFVGVKTGVENTIGISNTCLGFSAGLNNTEGDRNTFLGVNSGYSNTLGYSNTYVGFAAGFTNIIGDRNTFIGDSSGYLNTGSGNVFIGYYAGHDETGSDKLYIDNTNTDVPLLYGDFFNNRLVINGNGTHNGDDRTFFVNGEAGGTTAWFNDSDARLKKNVTTIENPLTKVMSLRGVNYEWIDAENHSEGLQMGFIAQEVEGIVDEVVSNKNDRYSMQYAPLTALLVEAIKEQQRVIEEQNAKIASLNTKVGEIEELKASNDKLQKQFANLESLIEQLQILNTAEATTK